MADYLPQNSGLWSTTTWITAFSNLTALAGGNVPPTVIDDVYADGKFITIDINTQVRTLLTSITPRTGGLAGGGYFINNAISLSANLSGGTTNCLTFLSAAPNSCTLVGNLTGSSTAAATNAFVNNSTGTINVFGNVKGGSSGAKGILNNSSGIVNIVGVVEGFLGATSYGVLNNSTGTVNVTGSVIGAPAGAATQPDAIRNQSTGTVNVSGLVQGGTSANGNGIRNEAGGIVNIIGTVRGNSVSTQSYGVNNISTGTVSVTGTVIAGSATSNNGLLNSSVGSVFIFGDVFGSSGQNTYGILNNAAGYVSINGNVIAGTGSTAYGAFNNATGYLEVNGLAIGNAFGLGSAGINSAPGIFGSQTGTTIIRGLSCGARGQWPTAGNVFIVPQSTSTATLFTSASAAQVLFTSLSTNIVPPASSVRLGTRYNLNQSTGTCAIPSISSVLQGVSVDNSIGIAALQPQTIWNYSVLSATDVNSLGGRLANVATVQSVGQQLTALN